MNKEMIESLERNLLFLQEKEEEQLLEGCFEYYEENCRKNDERYEIWLDEIYNYF